MKLCIPACGAFKGYESEFLNLVDGVVYKRDPRLEKRYPNKFALLESSLNLTAPNFVAELENSGFAAALRGGNFVSFSCDLGPVCSSYRVELSANGFPRYVPAGAVLSDECIGDICRENLVYIREFYDGDIEVENLNYFPTGAYERVCEPEWIGRMVEECGVGLALDLGHAIISAQNMGADIHSYLLSLPIAYVSQIHLSQPLIINGVLEDAHESPTEFEYGLVEFILEHIQPHYITVEYYRDGARLLEVYRKLRDMMGRGKQVGAV
jgi:uncharacterized protein